MFARLSSVIVVCTLAASAMAAPSSQTGDAIACGNGGTLQCCNTVESSNNLSGALAGLLTLLGVDISKLTGQVGASCTGINVIGVGGGTSCSNQPVCCTGNNFSGVVAIGCTPINISL
ncbi:hypothetical protein CC1G_04060 [Coprinopsis cinerea okayama7|uniref:Hydrophobin n=1 Tax=Coprinopsis cinerea (strain Okayama-7 / 130 / ATCC MYA-4618 / FGSC 9003) TaxID=240176 RepID=A8NVS9_COPC7|nr:hypothetical protein CC1G_04060 [Coprinopsis cinerea okayama7\|eukprot:XP_001836747.1 hypothetical protein CC1G_04060 [Coprinopsis cinerea okayama7\